MNYYYYHYYSLLLFLLLLLLYPTDTVPDCHSKVGTARSKAIVSFLVISRYRGIGQLRLGHASGS